MEATATAGAGTTEEGGGGGVEWQGQLIGAGRSNAGGGSGGRSSILTLRARSDGLGFSGDVAQ